MQPLHDRWPNAVLNVLLYLMCLFVWWILYGAPERWLGAGFTDCRHVVLEGIAALLLLVPALRERPLPPPEGRGRHRSFLGKEIVDMKKLFVCVLVLAGIWCLSGCRKVGQTVVRGMHKPVLYLYPETDVRVGLDLDGESAG